MKKNNLFLCSLTLAFAMAGTGMAAETEYTIKSDSTQYVSVEYPVLEYVDGFGQGIIDAVNEAFADTAEEYLELEQSAMEKNAEEIVEYNPEVLQYLTSEITCDGVYRKDNVYSVVQFYYTYTGGVHGYGMSVGTNYNLETGEEMTMAELLGCEEQTAQEAVVDAYWVSIIGQVENITEDTIRGCFDSMEYWMTEEGLRVSIPAYVAASYAAGPQEVTVTPEMVAAAENKLAQNEYTEDILLPETVAVINGIEANAADFIFPYSGRQVLTSEDLTRLEGADVEEEHYKSQLAINEMLARYGYAFKPEYGGSGEEAYNHFHGLAWYEEAKQYCPYDTANDVLYNCLNEIELQNVDIICEWQKEHGCYY